MAKRDRQTGRARERWGLGPARRARKAPGPAISKKQVSSGTRGGKSSSLPPPPPDQLKRQVVHSA
jgi:hypothetical protein